MRRLEIVSAALAVASAVMIFSFTASKGETGLLNSAGTFCIIIAIYQLVNFYFGLTLQRKRGKNDLEDNREIPADTAGLRNSTHRLGEKELIELPSITENTTELLAQRKSKPAEHERR
jgi:hypothetical protein